MLRRTNRGGGVVVPSACADVAVLKVLLEQQRSSPRRWGRSDCNGGGARLSRASRSYCSRPGCIACHHTTGVASGGGRLARRPGFGLSGNDITLLLLNCRLQTYSRA